jgi:hypothetical protein
LVVYVDRDGRDELDAEVAKLARQVARFSTPPTEVAATAEGLSRRLAGVLAKLATVPFDSERLFLRLASETDLADRQSAEQVYLALRCLSADLLARNPELSRAGVPATLEAMRRTLASPYDWNAGRFASQLAELKRQVESEL